MRFVSFLLTAGIALVGNLACAQPQRGAGPVVALCPEVTQGAVESALTALPPDQTAALLPIFEACALSVDAAKAWAALLPTAQGVEPLLERARKALGEAGTLEPLYDAACSALVPKLFGSLVEADAMGTECDQTLMAAFASPAVLFSTLELLEEGGPGTWVDEMTLTLQTASNPPLQMQATLVSRSGNPKAVDAALLDLRTLVAGILSMPDQVLARRLLRTLFVEQPERPSIRPTGSASQVFWLVLDAMEAALADSANAPQEFKPQIGFPGVPLPDHPKAPAQRAPLLASLRFEMRTIADFAAGNSKRVVDIRMTEVSEAFTQALLSRLNQHPCVSDAEAVSSYGLTLVAFRMACETKPPEVKKARREAIEERLIAPYNAYMAQQAKLLANPGELPSDPMPTGQSGQRADLPPLEKWILCEEAKGCRVDRAVLARYLEDMGALGREARIIPNYDRDSGTYRGFKLVGIKPGSIYRAIGLRSGDIVVQVNGEELSSPGKAMEVFNQLSGVVKVVILLLRQGKPFELPISIEDGVYKP